MKATDTLMAEHRVILGVLDSLEAAARRLQAGQQVRPGFFLDAARFIREFADGCHHRKEEGALFAAMVAAGMPREAGPVGVMLFEHEEGRQFTRGMAEAAGRLEAGEAGAAREVATNALGYVNLLRQHIVKEDRVLFPMAAQVIPAGRQPALDAEFERIELEETGPGAHEQYEALAVALAREAGAGA